jgi:chromosomal replication initiation ATPase DnaA
MTAPLPEQRRQALSAAIIRDRLYNGAVAQKKPDALALALEENKRLTDELNQAMVESAAKVRRIARLQEALAAAKRDLQQFERFAKFISHEMPSPDDIVLDVMKDFPDVTWQQISSRRKAYRVVRCRHLCMAAVREKRPDLSFPDIGRLFNRDHTSVMHAVKKIEAERAASTSYGAPYNEAMNARGLL